MTTGSASPALRVTQARDVAPGHLQLTADVVVVGSGAGGAVMAYELARAGRKVIVLEAGPYVPSGEFREDFAHALRTLYQDQGSQANDDGDLIVLQGRCLGGSTVVNATAALRVPDFVLADWQRDHGLRELTPAALAPHYAAVEKALSVHVNAPHEINRNSDLIRQGCERLGVSWKPLPRNIRDCALTGHCLSGCATDRKQSMLVTYLPWASAHGAQLFADAWVERVQARDGRVQGVVAQLRDPATGAPRTTLTVTAPRVVLAAGAVQTPALLQRSELALASGQVGRNFACHPSLIVVGRYAEPVHSWRGALLGIYVDEWMAPAKGGFLLEAGGAGPVELCAVTEPGSGAPFLRFMQDLKHLAGLITLIHDGNNGTVQWDGERARIAWRLSPADFGTMKAALQAAAEIHFAAGAEQVHLPTVAPGLVRRGESVAAALAGLPNESHIFRMTSYHPQGTCRMGADPARSVVGPRGESHEVRGLYISDASLFPSSILVNPQLTVYALSRYLAGQFLRRA